MSTLAAEEKVAPRSLLRHRPIGNTASQPGISTTKRSSNVTAATQIIKPRASRMQSGSGENIAEWKYTPTGEKRTPVPGLQSQERGRTTQAYSISYTHKTLARRNALRTMHPLLYLGGGMLVTLVLWIALSAISGWFTTTFDDFRYGRPRTFQTDAWVGHNEQTGVPSHFIALNLNGHIEIIEIPGGDASHMRVYIGPQLYGTNAELSPVTLTFADVNGDHKLDMIVNFQGSHIVYINDQGGFRPALPSEHAQVEGTVHHLG